MLISIDIHINMSIYNRIEIIIFYKLEKFLTIMIWYWKIFGEKKRIYYFFKKNHVLIESTVLREKEMFGKKNLRESFVQV